jgi:hypothetical protein
MVQARSHPDKPEPRWQALLALLAAVATGLALPQWLSVGPRWMLPLIILILLIPTVFAHRTGRHSMNHYLGIAISGLLTCGLIGSVILLITALPSQKEPPIALLRSAGTLWLSNVLVFGLWYWRLDGGGPNARDERRAIGSCSFVFPRCRWRNRCSPILESGNGAGLYRLPLHCFHHEHDLWPDRCAILRPWAKMFAMLRQVFP